MQRPDRTLNPITSLERLLRRRCEVIVTNEQTNDGKIHLYDTGLFWITFDKSAYLATKVFPEEAVIEVVPPGYPFRMLATPVSYKNLKKYSGIHILDDEAPDHRIVYTRKINIDGYRRWKRKRLG